ncbi:MAG: DUF5946 family protein [Bacteroidota bacterium]
MQNYIDFAAKNGVTLPNKGRCQFCGADTQRGVHECLEIFNLGFQLNFSSPENHLYRFLIVDAHALQHPEVHGRWSNHFHLSRLHLIFRYQVHWTYELSPRLSDHLNRYKASHPNEHLLPPEPLHRGSLTTSDIISYAADEIACKDKIHQWAKEAYDAWKAHHKVAHRIAHRFLGK